MIIPTSLLIFNGNQMIEFCTLLELMEQFLSGNKEIPNLKISNGLEGNGLKETVDILVVFIRKLPNLF